MPTPCPRDPHGSHLSSSPQTSHDYCEDGVRHPVFLCASTAWAPPGAPSRGCSAGFGNGHRREHHPEAALQASGMGTAGSTIQRLLCRLRERAPLGASSRGCSAGFGNVSKWACASRVLQPLPPLHVDCFRFLYVGVMVWAGDQQPTTQKPNLAHYFCFIILFYIIYFFKWQVS